MNAVQRVKANIAAILKQDNDEWTIQDVLADPDKAAEVIKLAITDKDFVSFEFKSDTKRRTDISTARKMLNIRNTLSTFTETEENSTYAEFWKEMRDVNDSYFFQFVIDLYTIDENFLNTVNRLRKEKKEAAIERGKKAAAARKAKVEAEKQEEEKVESQGQDPIS